MSDDQMDHKSAQFVVRGLIKRFAPNAAGNFDLARSDHFGRSRGASTSGRGHNAQVYSSAGQHDRAARNAAVW